MSSAQVVPLGRDDDRPADDVGDLHEPVDEPESRSAVFVRNHVAQVAWKSTLVTKAGFE